MSEVQQATLPTTRARSWVLAGCFAAGFAALYAVAILTPAGQRWDAASFGAFAWLRGDGWLALFEVRDWIPIALLIVGAAAGIEGIVRRRWSALIAAGALIALTGIASHVLKAGALPRPYFGDFAYTYQTFPSGHTALSLAAVVAIVWFGPRWLHPAYVVAMGALVGVVGLASLLSYAHRASDVIGGALLVGVFACAISAVVGVPALRRGTRRAGWTIAGAVGIAVCIVLLLISIAPLFSQGVAAAVDADMIGISFVAGTAGAIIVVLANQFPLVRAEPQRRAAP